MAFLNPRFSIAGTYSGEASGWTLITYTAAERIAGFGPAPYMGREDFERRFELWSSLEQVEIAAAFFDPIKEAAEDFEEAWDNDVYHLELPVSRIIQAAFDDLAAEGFETGWENDPFARHWDEVAAVDAVFDGNAHDEFETGWRENESFIRFFEDAESEAALFDEGAATYEGFSGDWTASGSES